MFVKCGLNCRNFLDFVNNLCFYLIDFFIYLWVYIYISNVNVYLFIY